MSEQLLESVKLKYWAVAESSSSNDHAGVRAVAQAFGYTAEELTSIPAEAQNGPFVRQFHSYSASPFRGTGRRSWFKRWSRCVPGGQDGRSDRPRYWHRYNHGYDRTRTRKCSGQRLHPCRVIPFHHRPDSAPDASVDCVVSTCVLNLAPDKPAVFREIARVLKPGGRSLSLTSPRSTHFPKR